MPHFYHIPCTIERGGFASERKFTIAHRDGQLVGTADIEYLCNENREALNDDEPPLGQVINGFVKCRKIRDVNEGGSVLVEVPSTDLVLVPEGDLVEAAC